MCGIAGVWGQVDQDLVRQMMERLAHRGPDGEGVYANGVGVLGHKRLAIMDPERGAQPIYDESGERAIVANGEIYNAPVLRSRLQGRHFFRTGSDSEVPLHLYEDVGEALVRSLSGMFAFAIADGSDVLLARDPIGIKPLYYGRREGALVFASELKALVGLAEDVREFPPGTFYDSAGGGFRTYYVVPDRDPVDVPLQRVLENLRSTLEGAVRERLMSDVPVGAFLSGGLDSSLIAALLRPHVEELHTFSVGTEGSADLEAARVVAEYLGTEHHEYVIDPAEVAERLPEIVYHLESFDRDLVRSAVPCWFVSRLAAEHVKVILTGEGADELFAGYDYYRSIEDPGTLQRELWRSVTALHDINLQRVDRLTMAHSLEGRVPFLDTEMVELSQRIEPELKLRDDGNGRRWEKWVLRKAFEDRLPDEIVWRDKEQFDEGSGSVDLLQGVLDRFLSEEDATAYAGAHAEADLRCREECVYHLLLDRAYGGAPAVFDNVARWAQRPGLSGQ